MSNPFGELAGQWAEYIELEKKFGAEIFNPSLTFGEQMRMLNDKTREVNKIFNLTEKRSF